MVVGGRFALGFFVFVSKGIKMGLESYHGTSSV